MNSLNHFVYYYRADSGRKILVAAFSFYDDASDYLDKMKKNYPELKVVIENKEIEK